MKKNMGKTDRITRIFLAILFTILILTGIIKGTIAIILGLIAIILLVTSSVAFCPSYVPLGISTIRKTKEKDSSSKSPEKH